VADGGYPIVLDVRDRSIVVVGGGKVALRKVLGLIESGAKRIKVVSPTFHSDMPLQVQYISESYRREHLLGASLVFAATDSSQVNDAIVRDARSAGAWVCRADADDDHAGDFATPAMLRQEELLITVSSGGSPALSALIRDKLKQAIDPRWGAMAHAMRELRPLVLRSLEPARRKQAFHELCSDVALEELSTKGLPGLKNWLKSKYPELKDAS